MKYAIFENGVYVGFSTIPFETDNKNVTTLFTTDEEIAKFEQTVRVNKD
ncbi:MAG: hypothetical protein IJ817_00090 [Clostridia bacterium]|nr:hypothetical protein [Clostridia bacterium]